MISPERKTEPFVGSRAEELCELGFSVFPLHPRSKFPAGPWKAHQAQKATSGECQRWQNDGYNLGIATGFISNLVVLDCDSAEAVSHAKVRGIPAGTPSVRTANGEHFYFLHPGFNVPNRTKFLPGMDLRGDGGYVVGPGSTHPSGITYQWANHPAWSEFGPMPDWLLNATRKRASAEPPISPEATVAALYCSAGLDRELALLRNAREGARNDQLNRSAFALGQLAAGGHIDANSARAGLQEAAVAIGLDSAEIDATIESGWRAGWGQPRGPDRRALQQSVGPTIVSARDLSHMAFPPLRWAIPELLPEGLALLAGKPKLGKSFLCLQLAIAVATGEGRGLGVGAFDAGDVLVCALEDGLRRLKDRLARLHPFGAPERLEFATGWLRFDQGGIEALDEWCDAHPEARLIVIDTWRAIKPHASGRGSAYDDDARAAAPLLEFAKRHPGLAIIVVHHVRKLEADDVFDTISGTNGLTGVFDTLLVLTRDAEGAKLAAQGRDLDGYEKALERDRATGGWTIKGNAVELAKTGERRQIQEILIREAMSLPLNEIATRIGKRPDTTRRLLEGLVGERLVFQPKHGEYLATQLAQLPQYDL